MCRGKVCFVVLAVAVALAVSTEAAAQCSTKVTCAAGGEKSCSGNVSCIAVPGDGWGPKTYVECVTVTTPSEGETVTTTDNKACAPHPPGGGGGGDGDPWDPRWCDPWDPWGCYWLPWYETMDTPRVTDVYIGN